MRKVVKLRFKRYERNGKPYVSYLLTAPKAFVETLGWGEGTLLEVSMGDGFLIYRPYRVKRRKNKRHIPELTDFYDESL